MAKKFVLSERSLNALKGVDKRLQDVVALAITLSTEDFMVTEGLRTMARQKILMAQGASKTLNSKHLEGYAVDLCPVAVKGAIPWGDEAKFKAIAKAMFDAAKQLGITLRWGGSWNGNLADNSAKNTWDKPHFELYMPKGFVKGF